MAKTVFEIVELLESWHASIWTDAVVRREIAELVVRGCLLILALKYLVFLGFSQDFIQVVVLNQWNALASLVHHHALLVMLEFVLLVFFLSQSLFHWITISILLGGIAVHRVIGPVFVGLASCSATWLSRVHA